MAKERIGMRRIKEVLRLGFGDKYSMNKIARCLNVGRSTVRDYFRRFKIASLSWPLAPVLQPVPGLQKNVELQYAAGAQSRRENLC